MNTLNSIKNFYLMKWGNGEKTEWGKGTKGEG